MLDGRIRFYMDTTHDDEGRTVARVMERPRPFAEAICVDTFSYEWRAVRKISELKRDAQQRGERVVYNPGDSINSWID